MRYSQFTPYDIVLLLDGLGVSLALFLTTSLAGMVFGGLLGLVRYYRVPVAMAVVTFVTELLKNSPVLVQLFLVFFGLPAFLKIDVTPIEAAFITLSLNTGAFIYVIVVSAIESIGSDQIEAARVFGLTRWQVLIKIISPQAIAFAAGPLTALFVNQLQVTSLISVIGVVDLTKTGDILNMRTLKPFIVWTAVGVLYYVAAKIVALGGAWLERRLSAHSAWKGF
jgi:glutamine transport system permease protein